MAQQKVNLSAIVVAVRTQIYSDTTYWGRTSFGITYWRRTKILDLTPIVRA